MALGEAAGGERGEKFRLGVETGTTGGERWSGLLGGVSEVLTGGQVRMACWTTGSKPPQMSHNSEPARVVQVVMEPSMNSEIVARRQVEDFTIFSTPS